jgi:hypothetical protein
VAVTERGVSSGYHASGTSQVATFPSGVAVGDLLLLFCADAYTISAPSGWSTGFNTGATPQASGGVFWKIATSTEVLAGSATYTVSGSYRGGWCVVALVGGTFLTTANLTAATSSTNAGANWVAACAFDRFLIDSNVTHAWASSNGSMPQWLQVQVAVAQIATGYTMTARDSYADQAPNSWTFLGSNDGSTWTTLDTQSGVTWSNGQTKKYTFSNSTAYTYYRVNITAINGGTNAAIAELTIAGVSTDSTAYPSYGGGGAASLPYTSPPFSEDAGQRAYHFASCRADSAASGGVLSSSVGSASVQRTGDAYWMTSLYVESPSSFGAVEPVWSSATGINGIGCVNLVVRPSEATPPGALRQPTIVASQAAQRASRW